jgi:hypothetical protein
MKIRTLIGAVSVAAALASCGLSADGRLALFTPTVATEYRVQGTTDRFVGCDNLDGVSAKTQVRVNFSSSGFVKTATVRLVGNTTTAQDNNFVANFARTELIVANENKDYTLYFDADAETGQLLPTSTGLSSQAIVVNPTRRTIKNVTVSGNPIGGVNGGFKANLSGTSDQDSPAQAPLSAITPVYTNCTTVSDTGVTL